MLPFLLVTIAIYIRLGLVPFITTATFAATGSIGYALIYPIVVPAVCFVLGVLLMPKTRKITIWQPTEAKAAL